MSITKEQREIIRKAKSAKELIELAKQQGIELTDEQATSLLTAFQNEGELMDEELENVSGGLCSAPEAPTHSYKLAQLRDESAEPPCECGHRLVKWADSSNGHFNNIHLWCASCDRYLGRIGVFDFTARYKKLSR